MSDRKYSVQEIDRLRYAVWYRLKSQLSWGSSERQASNAIVEEQVRTYMLNGTDPAELELVAGAKLLP